MNMKSRKPLKYLAFREKSWESKEELFELADRSIYYWWWAFLRVVPEFWYAKHTGHPIQDPQLKKIYELIGGLPSSGFKTWWNSYGNKLFTEVERDDQVRLITSLDLKSPKKFNNSVLIEVPLTENKREIYSQFVNLINTVHRGRKYDSQEYSNALLKLATHKYNQRTIQKEYFTMLYKLLFPKAPLWVIGDRLALAPHLHEIRRMDRKTNENNMAAKFSQMQSIAWRHNAKGLALRENVKYGSFPNYIHKKPDPAYKPFGEKYHADYLAATDLGKLRNSAWQKWLAYHLESRLLSKVSRFNGFTARYSKDSIFYRNLMKFLHGEIEM
jgi:hypothetical protein